MRTETREKSAWRKAKTASATNTQRESEAMENTLNQAPIWLPLGQKGLSEPRREQRRCPLLDSPRPGLRRPGLSRGREEDTKNRPLGSGQPLGKAPWQWAITEQWETPVPSCHRRRAHLAPTAPARSAPPSSLRSRPNGKWRNAAGNGGWREGGGGIDRQGGGGGGVDRSFCRDQRERVSRDRGRSRCGARFSPAGVAGLESCGLSRNCVKTSVKCPLYRGFFPAS